MADRSGIFAGEDPYQLARVWMSAAAETEPGDVNAVTLATVDSTGLPNARVVLLKEIAADALVFFTNYSSVKGREIEASGNAAIVIHWKTISRQIRARGRVVRLPAKQSDEYFASRPLASRIGALASDQSQPVASREHLAERVKAVQAQYGASPPRPAHWGGYRLVPHEIEFWAEGPFRLHDRFRWRRTASNQEWHIERLNP